MDIRRGLNHPTFNAYLFLSLGILCIVLIRIRFLDFPLERDEGEYAYMGQLILKSIPPYKLAYNMKFPGTYYMYALIMWLFGESTPGIHIGLLICNVASTIILFVITRKLSSVHVAVLASVLFGWMAISATVLGFAGHATHFVLLMAIIGTWIIQLAIKKESYIFYALSGIFYCLSFIMKQHGVFFIAMGQIIIILYHTSNDLRSVVKASLCFIGGATFTILVLYLSMYLFGVLEKFWFWTVTYAMSYENQFSITGALKSLLFGVWYVTRSFFIVWIFSFIGMMFLLVAKNPPVAPNHKLFIIIFTIFSFLTVVPGFYFRPHYFITLLPAISILAAIGAVSLFDHFKKGRLAITLSTISILFAILVGVYIERNYFLLEKSPQVLSYAIYSEVNAFPATQKAAEFIKANTDPLDRIFVFGSEPQIYFYSNRISATGYLYMYPLVEHHNHNMQMQREMISEVEAADPEILVYMHTVGSLSNRIETLPDLLSWFENYSTSGYREVGIIDIISNDRQIIRWDKDVNNYTPVSNNFIRVFKRKFSH